MWIEWFKSERKDKYLNYEMFKGIYIYIYIYIGLSMSSMSLELDFVSIATTKYIFIPRVLFFP